MSRNVQLVLIAIVIVLVAGPLMLALAGALRARSLPAAKHGANAAVRDPALVIASTLLYTLAFNLTFVIQELFLVLPKALTPGLRPTLFHNNHRWEGDSAFAALFQGTGALATLIAAGACALLLRRIRFRSVNARLFLVWMVYCGCFMALPQVVIGALSAGSDVGMAMDYFRLSPAAKTLAALIALVSMPVIALWLARELLGLATNPAQIDTASARSRFIACVATLPALAAVGLIIPFRVPREIVEVVVLPIVVSWAGVAWMQAASWRIVDAARIAGARTATIAWPLVAVVLLLLFFQFVLRPGIHFY